jgi:hypothetical protein
MGQKDYDGDLSKLLNRLKMGPMVTVGARLG